MDLNHIEFSGFLVTELYKDSLVIDTESKENYSPNESSVQKIEPELNKWKFLGGNEKNILLLLNNRSIVHLPDEDLVFLTGILAACKLSVGDVTILNVANYPSIAYQPLLKRFSSEKVLLFDVPPESLDLPISFPHFQLQNFAGVTYLSSPSLNEISNDKMLKTQLWNCLKTLFSIK